VLDEVAAVNRILPEAPKGVRGTLRGIDYRLSIHYIGPTPEGHLWEARWPEEVGIPWFEDVDEINCDYLPAGAVMSTLTKTRR
jgi:hypothetical protein